MCMCLAQGGEEVRGLRLGFTNPVGTGEMFDVCLCMGCDGVGGGEWVGGLDQGLEGVVVLYLCEL